MICPKCFSENITPIGSSHYICNNEKCPGYNGGKVQFHQTEDDAVRFPYNQIFVNRSKDKFYRKSYLKLASVGVREI